MERKKRILTGDRPTGPLHLGHYVGSLKNRIKLQDDYECFFIIADLQVLTDHLTSYPQIEKNVFEIMCDYLAVGLRPENTFFVQSQVPELAELTMYFSFLVSLSVLQRNPTLKEEAKNYGVKAINYGFFGYPISQAADILFCKADLVPVGRDQLPHIEQTREIARSFNRIFGKKTFSLPKPLLSECPTLVGLDGFKKMSKSLDNFIALSHSPKEMEHRILNAFADPKRIYRKDAGHPDTCALFKYYCLFKPEEAPIVKEECQNAKRGCKECKIQLAQYLNDFLREIREKRPYYVAHPDIVWDILAAGNKKARKTALQTLEQVREAMKISYPKLKKSVNY